MFYRAVFTHSNSQSNILWMTQILRSRHSTAMKTVDVTKSDIVFAFSMATYNDVYIKKTTKLSVTMDGTHLSTLTTRNMHVVSPHSHHSYISPLTQHTVLSFMFCSHHKTHININGTSRKDSYVISNDCLSQLARNCLTCISR